MVINPFIVSSKIEREYFCDRKKESEDFIRLLTNGNNVVLISPRRMGKTGLIQYCYDDNRIKDHYHTFYIDILQTTTLREFIFLLGKQIFSVLAPKSSKLAMKFLQVVKSFSGKLGFDPVTGLPSLNIQLGDIAYPEITLDEIFDYLNHSKTPSIIAIDEFQQITNYPEKNIEAMLRSRIQQTIGSRFIFSGSQRHVLGEMFVSSARPFFNSASVLNLEAIPEEIYVNFIIEKFKEKGKQIRREDAEAIYRRFDGHTFYVQRTCNEAFSCTPHDGCCSSGIITSALDNILSANGTLFRETLRELTENQKEVVYAIATEGKAKSLVSEAFIRKYALGSASKVQTSVRSLLNKEILTQNEEEYWIYNRFFGLWIQRMLAGDI